MGFFSSKSEGLERSNDGAEREAKREYLEEHLNTDRDPIPDSKPSDGTDTTTESGIPLYPDR